jgi:acetyl-CoA C-acetyltransferase
MSASEVFIVSGARTPMGGLNGSLSPVSAPELGTTAIAAALERAAIEGPDVESVIMGCVLPAGLKQAPARQAALGAGIPSSTGCTTVNKMCGSGMEATILAHDRILAGSYRLMVAGGMESMSNAPHLLVGARQGLRLGHGEIKDHMFLDGLEDAYSGKLMGAFAQEMATTRGLSREDMDAFAIESLSRANRAISEGLIADEIVPVRVTGRKSETIVDTDEQPLTARPDKIPQLKPAFARDGTVTAANSSSISDGASALVLMSGDELRRRGLEPMARIVGHATHARDPSEFTVAPIGAVQRLLETTGWSTGDVDLYEINEAFAMVTMLAMRDLDLDPARVNVHGGACAQGHPVGSTGSRIIVTLMHALRRYGKRKGIAALCIGGGEATAVAIEMV